MCSIRTQIEEKKSYRWHSNCFPQCPWRKHVQESLKGSGRSFGQKMYLSNSKSPPFPSKVKSYNQIVQNARAESLHKERSVRNKKSKWNQLLKLRGERGSWRFDECLLCWGLRRQTFDAWVWGRQAHRWSSWTSPSGSSPAPCLRTAPSETCFYMGSLCSP